MSPIHTGVDHAEPRSASSPLSYSSHLNGDGVEHESEPDEMLRANGSVSICKNRGNT